MGKDISSREFFVSLWLLLQLGSTEAYGKDPELTFFSDRIISMPMFYVVIIGHFRISLNLFLKASLVAHPFI